MKYLLFITIFLSCLSSFSASKEEKALTAIVKYSNIGRTLSMYVDNITPKWVKEHGAKVVFTQRLLFEGKVALEWTF